MNKDLVNVERQLKNEQASLVHQRDEVIKQLEMANETLKREVRERTDLMVGWRKLNSFDPWIERRLVSNS